MRGPRRRNALPRPSQAFKRPRDVGRLVRGGQLGNQEVDMRNNVVSHEDWLKARLELLAAEKEFTRQRDALMHRRMAMPWERVEKPYRFEGPDGALSLAD